MESCRSKKRKCQCHSIANQVGWHCIPLPKPKRRNLVYFIFSTFIYFKGVYFWLRYFLRKCNFFMTPLYLALFMRCNRHYKLNFLSFFFGNLYLENTLPIFLFYSRPRCPGPRFRTWMASNSFPSCGSRQLCHRREHCNDYILHNSFC